MVHIWGRNVKHRKVSLAHHDPNYGPGVLTLIGPIGGGTHHMPWNFSSENNNNANIPGWEAKCYQNTTAILVLKAPYNIKHNDFV